MDRAVEWVESQERIDMAVLQARDPILFYDEVIRSLLALNSVRKDNKWLLAYELIYALDFFSCIYVNCWQV